MKSAGEEFIIKTKYQNMGVADQMKGAPPPGLQLPYPETGGIISLPPWDKIQVSEDNIISIINVRQSIRNYKRENISLLELSYLLWCTQGVKEIISDVATLRTVPSAGGRHALETILLVNNVEELTPGLYRYLSLEHQLGTIKKDSSIVNDIVKASLNQDFIKQSAVTFIWIAIIYRMKWRYGERAYRYIFLDAGHVAQNLYLSAEAINCGVCVIGAFSDDELNSILDLDGQEQFVIYMATVGKKIR
ncbi:MAG: SagB/ThcOx family dehydrogenase [Atribacterota bacterium]